MADESRILVVDDEPNVCRSCSDMLSRDDWTVEVALSGNECLTKTEGERFDVVILDLKIPDIAGTELLRRIRGRHPETPVIMITGYSTVSSAVETMKLGAFDYIPKPFTPRSLRTTVERALEGRAAAGDYVITKEAVKEALAVPMLKPAYTVKVKPELCYGCLGCVVACAYENLGLPEDAPLRQNVLLASRLTVEAAGEYAVPLRCMQCADAPCMTVCPTGGLHRPDPNGPVLTDTRKCIGCKSCVLACPVGVLSLDIHGKMVQKCDMCVRRLGEGREPACVESCPMDALELVTVDELREEAARSGAQEIVRKLEEKEAQE